jgi:hypothetical protein
MQALARLGARTLRSPASAPRLLAAAAAPGDAGGTPPQPPASPATPQTPQFVADAQLRTEEELRRLLSRGGPQAAPDDADEAAPAVRLRSRRPALRQHGAERARVSQAPAANGEWGGPKGKEPTRCAP